MKLKWREHEHILIILLSLLTIGRYYRGLVLASYEHGYPAFFSPVDYYLHNFLPRVAPVLLLYFCYLWADTRIVPAFRLPSTASSGPSPFAVRAAVFLKQRRWPIIQVIALFILVSLGLNIAFNNHVRA